MRQQGVMKTSITWSPGAGLNVLSVQRGEQAWTVTVDSRKPSRLPVRDAVRSPHRVTALTRERFGIFPLREHRLLLTLASGAGGVETSCAIAAFSLSACRVSHYRSRVGPSASRKLSG